MILSQGTTDDRTWQALNRSLARVSAVHDGLPGSGGEGGAGPGGCRISQAGLEVADVCDMEEHGGCGQRQQQRGPQQQKQGYQEKRPARTAHSTAVVAAVAADAGQCNAELLAAAAVGKREGELPMAVEACPEAKAVPGSEASGDFAGKPSVAGSEGKPASGAGDSSTQQHGQGSKQPSQLGAAQAKTTTIAEPELLLVPCLTQEAGSAVAAAAARGGTGDMAVGSSPVTEGSADPSPIFFEVSLWTGRVHLHAAADGSVPLHLSLPAEALAVEESPILADLLATVTALRKATAPTPLVAATAAGSPGKGNATVAAAVSPPSIFVPGVGIAALPTGVTPATLAAWLAEAREFLSEWRELRSVHQLRLAGRVLRAPLDAEVEALAAAASASGALGRDTSRFVEQKGRPDLELPPGVAWHEVRVRFARYGSEATYQQPFLPDGSRLCLNCGAHVPGAKHVAENTVLEGTFHLFCW